MTGLETDPADPSTVGAPRRWLAGPRWHALALGILLSLVSSLILQETARGQFDWFDMSAFLDAGYRTWQGQEPYVDFFYLAQPLHLWFHALFFELFGFNQTAVLAHMHAFNAAAILLMTALAWRLLARGPALLVSMLFALSYYGPVAHPWYDQNAYFFILAGLVAVEFARTAGRMRAMAAFAAGAAAAASFMIKANVGLAGGGTLLVAVVFSAGLSVIPAASGPLVAFKRGLVSRAGCRAGWIPFSLGWGIVVAACLFALESPREFIFQTFIAYDSRSRLADIDMLRRVVLLLPFTWLLVLGIVLAKFAGREWRRAHAWDLVLLVFLALTGLATAYSGSLRLHAKITFVAPVLLYLFRLVRVLPLERLVSELVESMFGIVALFLLGYAALASWPPAAWQWRPSNKDSAYPLQVESFRGWKSHPATGIGVDRVVAWIRVNVPQDESLFVFPDCTIIYGMAGRESLPGTTFIWHLNHLPPPGPIFDRVQERLLTRPPQWVILHVQDEVTFFETNSMLEWMGIGRFLRERYQEAWHDGAFYILRLREAGSLSTPAP